MTMTMAESATRHMAAGVMDLNELARLVEEDTDRAPNFGTLKAYRSGFRKHGKTWLEAERRKSLKWAKENSEQVREKNAQWRASNPERVREQHQRWRAENAAKHLLKSCRSCAKQREHPCTITADDIEEMLAPMTCAATGLPLKWEYDGATKTNPWAPSIDRIDCTRGYVPGNVRVVCWAFNMMRSDWPDDVVTTLAKALVNTLSA